MLSTLDARPPGGGEQGPNLLGAIHFRRSIRQVGPEFDEPKTIFDIFVSPFSRLVFAVEVKSSPGTEGLCPEHNATPTYPDLGNHPRFTLEWSVSEAASSRPEISDFSVAWP